MLFVKKNLDYIIVGILVLFLGIIPFIKFVDRYLQWVKAYESSKMEIIEFWSYSIWVIDGTLIMMFSPFIIILFTTYRFFVNIKEKNLVKEEHDEESYNMIKRLVYREWIKSSLLMLSYSLLIFIIALVLPTSKTPNGALNLEEPIKLFIYFHINLVLFSIIITNIGLIAVRFTRKYVYTYLISFFSFIVITIGLSSTGAIIDVAFEGNINMDWFWIYNTIQFDSGMPYIFGTSLLVVLLATTILVLYQVYKGNTNLEK